MELTKYLAPCCFILKPFGGLRGNRLKLLVILTVIVSTVFISSKIYSVHQRGHLVTEPSEMDTSQYYLKILRETLALQTISGPVSQIKNNQTLNKLDLNKTQSEHSTKVKDLLKNGTQNSTHKENIKSRVASKEKIESEHNVNRNISLKGNTDESKNKNDNKVRSNQKQEKLRDEKDKTKSSHGVKQSDNIKGYDPKVMLERDKDMLSKYSTIFQQKIVNCSGIFNENETALSYGIILAQKMGNRTLQEEYYRDIAKNCESFIISRGYITSVLSLKEEQFPIAYSINAHRDIEMFERLLRQIYRPQNFYCVHVDLKAKDNFYKAVSDIANCFPNVFLTSTRILAVKKTFSVLEAELVCMKELYHKGSWKYFLNVHTGQMPLKTNLELVKIFTEYGGANDVQGSLTGVLYSRLKENEIGPAPFGLLPLKGSHRIAVSRTFVSYILHNKTAAVLLDWVKKTEHPEETYFTTLNHNPFLNIPGTFRGWPEEGKNNRKPYLVNLYNSKYHKRFNCTGPWEGTTCLINTGNLHFLKKRPELFVSGFQLSKDKIAMACLEEKLFNATRDGVLGTLKFNSHFYRGLGFVVEQVGRKLTKRFRVRNNVV